MAQTYFNTGRTIVIDDQYEEARPLLNALCKNHIPFVYTQGKENSDYPLPDNPQYYTLVFLDLNLNPTFGDEKTFQSLHANLFEKFLKNQNRSYILILWSNKEEPYKDIFLRIFDKNEKYSINKQPYDIITLTKSDFFTEKDGNFEFIQGMENELKDRINKTLSNFNAFKLLWEWEAISNIALGSSVDDFMSLLKNNNNININKSVGIDTEKDLSKILTRLSISHLGDNRFLKTRNNETKTNSALHVLSQMSIDDMDRQIYGEDHTVFKNWINITNIKKEIPLPLFNSKLLLFNLNSKKYLIHSVYSSKEFTNLKAILESIYNNSTNLKNEILELYKSGENTNEKPDDEMLKGVLLSHSLKIEVDITPSCDITNEKDPIHRLILGLAIPSSIDKLDLKRGYIFQSPDFLYEKTSYYMVLDFRYLITKKKGCLKKQNYLFTLRNNLVNDIQIKLASHVARLGTLNL